MARRDRIPASFWWGSLDNTFERVCREFISRARAAEKAEKGHECGHQFEITVRSADHGGIVGQGPESHIDGYFMDAMRPVTVRAHNLRDALLAAASLPLADWFDDEASA